ncbi:MAG: DUF3606 domain-containing protein [Mesorhizobium sp.]|nr:MAG: DUF3606 domain-containing protein [Mesorhizobium sp.]
MQPQMLPAFVHQADRQRAHERKLNRNSCVGEDSDHRRLSMRADAANLYPRDRDRISGSEAYVVRHLARQNGITTTQVHELINRYGGSRAKLIAAAKQLRSSTGQLRH